MLLENEEAFGTEHPDGIPGLCTSSNGVAYRSKVITHIYIFTSTACVTYEHK